MIGAGNRDGAASPDLDVTPDTPDLAPPAAPLDGSTAGCDDFSADAIGSPAAGWTALSGTWLVVALGGAQALKQTTAPTGGVDYLVSYGSPATRDSTIKVNLVASGGAAMECLAARVQDQANYYALCLQDNASWELEKVVAGSGTALASGTLTYVPGSTHILELQLQGAVLTPSLDGVQKPAVTDGTFTQGAAGLKTEADSAYPRVCVSVS